MVKKLALFQICLGNTRYRMVGFLLYNNTGFRSDYKTKVGYTSGPSMTESSFHSTNNSISWFSYGFVHAPKTTNPTSSSEAVIVIFPYAISNIDVHRLNPSADLEPQIGRIRSPDNPGELAYLTRGPFGNGDGLEGSNLFYDFNFFLACGYGNPYKNQRQNLNKKSVKTRCHDSTFLSLNFI